MKNIVENLSISLPLKCKKKCPDYTCNVFPGIINAIDK